MSAREELHPALPMPIKATPYRHQIEAFNYVCWAFGLARDNAPPPPAIQSAGWALLMEMGTGKSLMGTGGATPSSALQKKALMPPGFQGNLSSQFQKVGL